MLGIVNSVPALPLRKSGLARHPAHRIVVSGEAQTGLAPVHPSPTTSRTGNRRDSHAPTTSSAIRSLFSAHRSPTASAA